MKAIDFIRKGWTQDAVARTAKGWPCSETSLRAVKWCAWGAIFAAYRSPQKRYDALNRLYLVLGLPLGISVTEWNDHPKRTKGEVLAAFKKAGV